MRIGIDGRRNYGSGIGRVTSNLIEGFLDFDSSSEYIIFVNKGDINKKRLVPKKNAEIVECEIPYFSKKDLYELPKFIERKKVDIFISPQFYISPFIECSSIKMVHDLWPLLHPEWIPRQLDSVSHFGKESLEGVIELIQYFKTIYKQGLIFPQNEFIKEKIEKKRVKNTFLYMVAMMSLTLNTASKVVVPSFYTQNEISCVFPEVIKKIELISNFASPNFSSTTCKCRKGFLLHVSKWEPRKNIETMIKAVKIVQNKYDKYKLILVGDVGYRNYGKKMKNFISQRPYKDFVSHLGVVEDRQLSELYQSADIFLFPSLYEGFGIPVLEAMASGTPVIASNLTALPEICGDSALLIDPKNPYELADTIVQLLSNEELYNRLREKGLERVKYFDRSKIIRKFISIINSIT